jgi:hypothetical protein
MRTLTRAGLSLLVTVLLECGPTIPADQQGSAMTDELARGFLNPPADARPHVYWLWLNGYVNLETAKAELEAMKEAGIGGVLLFDMGARGDKSTVPPAGLRASGLPEPTCPRPAGNHGPNWNRSNPDFSGPCGSSR